MYIIDLFYRFFIYTQLAKYEPESTEVINFIIIILWYTVPFNY